MSLSYVLGDDDDLRRRLMVKIGAPLTALSSVPVTAGAVNNHTAETPDSDELEQITSSVYWAAQASSAMRVSGSKGETGAF